MISIDVTLPYIAPLDGDGLWDYLAGRTITGVESIDSQSYRRAVRLTHGPAVLELARPGDAPALPARVHLSDVADKAEAVAILRRTADLDRDIEPIHTALGAHPWLGPVVQAQPGVRAWQHSGTFEVALRAILAQQVSLTAARTHTARLVAAVGSPLTLAGLTPDSGELTHLFPTPEQVAAIDPEGDVLAMPAGRRRAVLGLARAVLNGLDLSGEPNTVEAGLLAVPGIGPWTTQYVRMRALGDPDAFCGSDLVLRRIAGQLSGGSADPRGAEFAPWRTYAAQHLWRYAQKEAA